MKRPSYYPISALYRDKLDVLFPIGGFDGLDRVEIAVRGRSA